HHLVPCHPLPLPLHDALPISSDSLTLLRSTYIENFFRKAGRMSADSASAWPSASGHIRKLAIMRPLGELKLFHSAASASSFLTSDRKSTRLHSSHVNSSYAVF